MTANRKSLALILVSTFAGYAAPSASQEIGVIVSGKAEFQISCAVCHGTDAKGSGPMAGVLRERPTNLTLISRVNGGMFPFRRVIETIDGRHDVASHGGRDMPVWGMRFREQQDPSVARARILELTLYLQSIQAN